MGRHNRGFPERQRNATPSVAKIAKMDASVAKCPIQYIDGEKVRFGSGIVTSLSHRPLGTDVRIWDWPRKRMQYGFSRGWEFRSTCVNTKSIRKTCRLRR